jgi:hypothetical protein
MMKPCLIILFLVTINLFAQPLTSITATPTFHNIGIDVQFDAATPEDATINIAVTELSSPQTFRNAHPLSRIMDDRFAGSIFQVKSNTAYIIRLTSALFPNDQYDTATTRSEAFPQATGTVYHVSPQGSDANTGLSLADAFATLGKAVSVTQAGYTVMLHEGRYYEEVTLPRSGNRDAPIVIRNAPGECAVLDGRDTAFSPNWIEHSPLPGIYKTPYSAECHLVFHNSKHLFRYNDLTAMGANSWSLPGAFYSDGDTLYVLFPHGGAPTAADTITAPAYTTAFTCEQDYIYIIGLEICYYGRNLYSRGLYLNNASYNLIDSCFFHHSNTGIGIKRASHFNTIQNCTFNDSPVETWTWQAIKEGTGYYESGAISVYSSDITNTGNVIRNNHISHKFDGVGLGSDQAPTTNMDFYNNTVELIGDDAVSMDGAGINNRIYNNRLSTFLVGVSVAPAAIGPHYIFRNLLISWLSNSGYDGYPIKLNVNSSLSTNWVYLYHNTCFTNVAGQDGFVFKQYSDWHDVISRNNIYAGTDYALNSSSDQNPVDFDYDNLYTTHNTNFIRWEGNRYSTIAEFFSATSQEEHGLSQHPDFVDTSAGNYHLNKTSKLIDKGVIIPGINDSFYNDAPDIGCFENSEIISIHHHVNPDRPGTLICYPSPCGRAVTIDISNILHSSVNASVIVRIVNMQGRVVYKKNISPHVSKLLWYTRKVNSGIYIVQLTGERMKYSREILLSK